MKYTHLLCCSLMLFLSIGICSCNDDENDPFIELDKTSITIDTSGGGGSITMKTNGKWEVKNIPDWMLVSPTAGDHSSEITITIAEKNPEFTRRKASLVFICGPASKILEVEQLSLMDTPPFIELSKKNLSMSIWGEEQKIQITSNTPWEATNIPQWISIDPVSGDQSTEITVRVLESREPEERQANLVFAGKNVTGTLNIAQPGLRDVIRSPLLPGFSFKSIEYTKESNLIKMETENLFVNPDIRNKIYLGNLICHRPASNTDIQAFTGYTFNPITISADVSNIGMDIVKTYLPSWEEQNAFARQIISKKPKQSAGFYTNNGTEFYTHKYLHTLGVVSLGVKLDELVSGFSFTEKEMTRKYGLIYSFKHTLFNLTMDLTDQLVKEELKEADVAKGMSYVNTVTYGKVGLLIVESDIDSRNVKTAIEKVIKDGALSPAESALIDGADICYVYFDNNNNVQVKKGKTEVIQAYRDALKDTDNIYPVGFYISEAVDSSSGMFSFSINVP